MAAIFQDGRNLFPFGNKTADFYYLNDLGVKSYFVYEESQFEINNWLSSFPSPGRLICPAGRVSSSKQMQSNPTSSFPVHDKHLESYY